MPVKHLVFFTLDGIKIIKSPFAGTRIKRKGDTP